MLSRVFLGCAEFCDMRTTCSTCKLLSLPVPTTGLEGAPEVPWRVFNRRPIQTVYSFSSNRKPDRQSASHLRGNSLRSFHHWPQSFPGAAQSDAPVPLDSGRESNAEASPD